jgi:hypothetical protein
MAGSMDSEFYVISGAIELYTIFFVSSVRSTDFRFPLKNVDLTPPTNE